ncbi:hypothetical protein HDU96_004818 [Phlyctochytrium bullatum]|nr:hypothetical protein HDU96_004818 [Phlyctochytrium bullatum]
MPGSSRPRTDAYGLSRRMDDDDDYAEDDFPERLTSNYESWAPQYLKQAIAVQFLDARVESDSLSRETPKSATSTTPDPITTFRRVLLTAFAATPDLYPFQQSSKRAQFPLWSAFDHLHRTHPTLLAHLTRKDLELLLLVLLRSRHPSKRQNARILRHRMREAMRWTMPDGLALGRIVMGCRRSWFAGYADAVEFLAEAVRDGTELVDDAEWVRTIGMLMSAVLSKGEPAAAKKMFWELFHAESGALKKNVAFPDMQALERLRALTSTADAAWARLSLTTVLAARPNVTIVTPHLYAIALRACAKLLDLPGARNIHALARRQGIDRTHLAIHTAMMEVYAAHGDHDTVLRMHAELQDWVSGEQPVQTPTKSGDEAANDIGFANSALDADFPATPIPPASEVRRALATAHELVLQSLVGAKRYAEARATFLTAVRRRIPVRTYTLHRLLELACSLSPEARAHGAPDPDFAWAVLARVHQGIRAFGNGFPGAAGVDPVAVAELGVGAGDRDAGAGPAGRNIPVAMIHVLRGPPLATDPRVVSALGALMAALREKGRAGDAVRVWREMVVTLPKFRIHEGLRAVAAEAFLDLGDLEEAKRVLTEGAGSGRVSGPRRLAMERARVRMEKLEAVGSE